MHDDIAIRLTNVSKAYRLYSSRWHLAVDTLGLGWMFPKIIQDTPTFLALKNLSLTVPRGSRLGVVGRNGAGKTTLLKLLTGNFAPTQGQVEVTGRIQALMDVGLGFHPDFTGFENIQASLAYNGLPRAELERAVEDVIDFVELGDFLHQPIKTYSLGMLSRLGFATSTAIKPDVLLMSKRTRRKLKSLLAASTHYVETGESSFGRQVLFYDGIPVLVWDFISDTEAADIRLRN